MPTLNSITLNQLDIRLVKNVRHQRSSTNLRIVQRFYSTNNFNEWTILLNDRSVRKRKKIDGTWRIILRMNEIIYFCIIKQKIGRSQTMNQQSEKSLRYPSLVLIGTLIRKNIGFIKMQSILKRLYLKEANYYFL